MAPLWPGFLVHVCVHMCKVIVFFSLLSLLWHTRVATRSPQNFVIKPLSFLLFLVFFFIIILWPWNLLSHLINAAKTKWCKISGQAHKIFGLTDQLGRAETRPHFPRFPSKLRWKVEAHFFWKAFRDLPCYLFLLRQYLREACCAHFLLFCSK